MGRLALLTHTDFIYRQVNTNQLATGMLMAKTQIIETTKIQFPNCPLLLTRVHSTWQYASYHWIIAQGTQYPKITPHLPRRQQQQQQQQKHHDEMTLPLPLPTPNHIKPHQTTPNHNKPHQTHLDLWNMPGQCLKVPDVVLFEGEG